MTLLHPKKKQTNKWTTRSTEYSEKISQKVVDCLVFIEYLDLIRSDQMSAGSQNLIKCQRCGEMKPRSEMELHLYKRCRDSMHIESPGGPGGLRSHVITDDEVDAMIIQAEELKAMANEFSKKLK